MKSEEFLKAIKAIKTKMFDEGKHWIRHWCSVSSIEGNFDAHLGDTYALFQFNDL
jgi:hypothetical protein